MPSIARSVVKASKGSAKRATLLKELLLHKIEERSGILFQQFQVVHFYLDIKCNANLLLTAQKSVSKVDKTTIYCYKRN